MTQTSNPDRTIPTRRISFEDALSQVPKHFAADGDLIMSHLVAAMSSVFPEGEEYFVRSVRHYRSEITDPELKRQVAGFIGQETVHGRQHRAFNDRLSDLGYPTKVVERIVKRVLRTRERLMSPETNLGLTAALEHFTATLAELALSDAEFRRLTGHEAVRDLFLWHSLEEAEHKAVAFDVFTAVGGRERVRVNTMRLARYGFAVAMTIQVILSLLGDRATYQRGRLRASWKRFKRSPFMSRELWDRLREYDRPGFHPDDRNTDDLVDAWREQLFGASGDMNDKLAIAA